MRRLLLLLCLSLAIILIWFVRFAPPIWEESIVDFGGNGVANPRVNPFIHDHWPADVSRVPLRSIVAYEQLGGTYGCWWLPIYDGMDWAPAGQYPPFREGGPPVRKLAGFSFVEFPKEKLPNVAVPIGLWLTKCSVTGERLRALGHLENLQLIELDRDQVDDDVLQALNQIGRLHALRIVGDHTRELAASANDVVRLELANTQVSDAGVRHLKPLRKLATLDLSRTRVTDAGLRELADLEFDSLDTLFLYDTVITSEGYQALSRLTSLNLLFRVSDRILDDAYVRELRKANLLHTWRDAYGDNSKRAMSAAEVTSLAIDSEVLTASGLKEFSSLTNLKSLKIAITKKLDNASLKELRPFTRLESLRIEDLESDDALQELAAFKNLRSLDLAFTSITGKGFKNLAAIESLVKVNFIGKGLTNDGFASLAELKNLVELNYDSRETITDAGVSHLTKLPRLKKLHLWQSDITNAGLGDLAKLKRLEILHLTSSKITDDGLGKLSDLNSLRELSITDSLATAAGKAALERPLPHCKIYVR